MTVLANKCKVPQPSASRSIQCGERNEVVDNRIFMTEYSVNVFEVE